jgi:hypothetical protein
MFAVVRKTARTPVVAILFVLVGRRLSSFMLHHDDRVFCRRPLFFASPAPVEVRVESIGKGPLLPGEIAEFEITTSRSNKPVSADLSFAIYQGNPVATPNLLTRELLAPVIDEESGTVPTADLTSSTMDRYLMVRLASAFSDEGDQINDSELHSADLRAVTIPEIVARPQALASMTKARKGKTRVRAGDLERSLRRAHFTRNARRKPTPHAFEIRAPEEALLATPELGLQKAPLPHDLTPGRSQVDTRRTLFWVPSIITDAKGKARVRLRINQVIENLSWDAQGRSRRHSCGGARHSVVESRLLHRSGLPGVSLCRRPI